MANGVDETHRHHRAVKKQRDFDDLQDEQSGRDTGRTKRYGVMKEDAAEAKRQKDGSFRTQLSALDQRLQTDPIYAALYNETLELISTAQQAAEQALVTANADLAGAETRRDDIQDRANQLPDGTRIYKDADGKVWTEDGRLVSKEELDSVVWKDGAPSREEYLSAQQAVHDAQKRIRALEDYLYNVIGPNRDRMTDPDNPPSQDDLDGIKGDIIGKAPAFLNLAQPPQSAALANTETEKTFGKTSDDTLPPARFYIPAL